MKKINITRGGKSFEINVFDEAFADATGQKVLELTEGKQGMSRLPGTKSWTWTTYFAQAGGWVEGADARHFRS